MSDIEVDYAEAKRKLGQLEDEINAWVPEASRRTDMRHTLSKIRIALGNIRDASLRHKGESK